jgi:hypothetical protein
MRNELEHIATIEKYLRNELSAEEKKAFEEKLKTDVTLQKEVATQRDIITGIERLGIKQAIQVAHKKYKLGKAGFNLGLGAIVLVAVTSVFLWYNSTSTISDENILPELNELGEKQWADADKLIPSQQFTINTAIDTVIETQGGIVMYIPKGSFLDDNGNTIIGNVDFEVKEALNTAQIVMGGLSSMSGDKLLESGGMFYINARQDGKTVKINPEQGIYTEVPTDEVNPNMQLFEGKRMDNGSIDWINPTPLEKFLTPVDINLLNFYPPKYEPKLAELGLDVTNKKYKDSLYYSFAWEDEDLSSTLIMRARHILIKDSSKETEQKLKDIRNSIKMGKSFTKIAKEISDDVGSAINGGEIGWFKKGAMVKPFEDACFNGYIGDMPIIKSEYGWHLIEILD